MRRISLKWKYRNMTWWNLVRSFFKYRVYSFSREDLSATYDCPKFLDPAPIIPRPESYLLLLKPLGLAQEKRIRALLKKYHVQVLNSEFITDYQNLALNLFPGVLVDEQFIWFKILANELPPDLSNCAKVLFLDKIPFTTLWNIKRELRRSTQVNVYRVYLDAYEYEMCITPFHLPDEKNQDREFRVCSHFFSRFAPISLISPDDPQMSHIGNKARNIVWLQQEGFPVLPGIIIPYRALETLLKENHQWDEFREIDNCSRFGLINVTRLRNLIQAIDLPDSFMEPIYKYFDHMGVDRFIVRSSSSTEDSATSSSAGAFLSATNLIRADLKSAIVNCFASLAASGKIEESAVIVQHYVATDLAGVAFTADPNDVSKETLWLEYHQGKCEDIVQGAATAIHYRDGDAKVPPFFSESLWTQFRHLIKDIQKRYKLPVDVEWGIQNGKICIFQVRPITTGKKKQNPPVPSFIRMDDKAEIDNYAFFTLDEERHQRWYEKHYFIRQHCLREHIRIPWAGYLTFSAKELDEALLERYLPKATIVKMVSRAKVRTLGRSKLLPLLQEIATESPITVRIEQINLTDYCGFSVVAENGDVIIEMMPGGFGGFMHDQFPFSKYIVSKDNVIKYQSVQTYDRIWKFDEAAGKFVPKNCNPIAGTIPVALMGEIVRMTSSLDKLAKKVSVEWVIDGDELYFHDASFESSSLLETNVLNNVISPGWFQGRAVKLLDTKELEAVTSSISVVPEADFLKKQRSKEVEEIIRRINPNGEKVVIVTPYPKPSLAFLMPFVEGYIFENGAFLSHLPIILREKRVPAIFLPNALKQIPEHSLVSFANNQLTIGKDGYDNPTRD